VTGRSTSSWSSARSAARNGPFELLVVKYQRKLERLLSRVIRDPAEIEDVAQEAFIKAYRALPNFRGDSAFYTWLYRIGINTAKNYLIALGRRAPPRRNSTARRPKASRTPRACATSIHLKASSPPSRSPRR
jgi:RNA polymerase sigma factor (sigma-70 family)